MDIAELRADYQSWYDRPHEYRPFTRIDQNYEAGRGCAVRGYGPGAYFHNTNDTANQQKLCRFPLVEGTPVRVRGEVRIGTVIAPVDPHNPTRTIVRYPRDTISGSEIISLPTDALEVVQGEQII